MFIDKSDMNLFNFTKNTFKIFSVSFLLLGFNVVISGFLASLERTADACIISLNRGLFAVSLSLIIMILIFGGNGIWISTIASEGLVLLLSIMLLKRFNKNLDQLTYNSTAHEIKTV
ncbi:MULTISPECIES: hypothetical protein [unclassified Romboutsia]|nr:MULTISPECIES: hypothetical protein [unclassified Romboutsia]MDB8805923.1 hypothetical protein [Romboutsia sp. 1001216sp1]MDB8807633.1 hypothetical protein [Romboutsia sp. 1001216sp1]MDB8816976.1 hypothetical protein [Romboutsia sp. 1001216sp1]